VVVPRNRAVVRQTLLVARQIQVAEGAERQIPPAVAVSHTAEVVGARRMGHLAVARKVVDRSQCLEVSQP
jgi:hypothetical protein